MPNRGPVLPTVVGSGEAACHLGAWVTFGLTSQGTASGWLLTKLENVSGLSADGTDGDLMDGFCDFFFFNR